MYSRREVLSWGQRGLKFKNNLYLSVAQLINIICFVLNIRTKICMLSVVMLNVIMLNVAECRYAECHYAGCRYAGNPLYPCVPIAVLFFNILML